MYRMAQRGKPQINISEVIPNARKARARFLQRASRAEESALLKAEVQRFCLSARAARKSSRNEENLAHSSTAAGVQAPSAVLVSEMATAILVQIVRPACMRFANASE